MNSLQAIEVQECRIEIGSAQSIGGPRPRVVAGDGGSRHMLPPQGTPHIALLRGLFQRASRDELRALRSLLTSNSSLDESSRQQAAQVLDDEIAKQWS